MKLNLFGATNTRDVEEKGRRVPIINIETGKPFQAPDSVGEGGVKVPGQVCTALIAGSYSDRFKAAQKRAAEKEEAIGISITDEEKEQIRLEMWADIVIEWDLAINDDPAVVEIFKMRPEIYDQTVKVSTDHAGFFVAL